jgi:hypothetical protein
MEGVPSDDTKSILFIKSLGPWIIFPDAQPPYIVCVAAGPLETRVHQVLADAFSDVLLM